MKILITGANGFLGHHLSVQLLLKGYEVIATGKGECRLPLVNEKGFQYLSMDFFPARSLRRPTRKCSRPCLHA